MAQYNSSYRPSSRSRSNGPRFRKITIVITFLIAVIAAIFVLYKILRREIVIIPSTAIYDDSLTDEEKSFLQGIFSTTQLAHDVTISAVNSSVYPDPDDVLYDILIPVTGFYNSRQNITASEALQLTHVKPETISPESESYYLLSIHDLQPNIKVLSMDDQYILDDFKSGAIFRVFHFQSDDTTEAKELIKSRIPQLPDNSSVLSFNQTGVTALSRAMITKLNQVGNNGAYFAEKIADFLKKTDLTHISNEVSFANNCTNSSSTALCSPPAMYETITAIGTDIVELTGNHNNDWGTADNIATIEKYHTDGIRTFGGGINETEAKIPLQISEKGTDITLIGINHSTSSKENGQGASGDHPGANIYDEATTLAQIKEAKARGDFVIVDIQFSECYCYPEYGEEMPACDYPIAGQQEFFRAIADMGADIILGTQAHQPQTYEIYNQSFIYYGTGNLFFDQTYWPGTERSLVFTHYFYNGKLLQTRLSPTIYDTSYQTHLMDENSSENFLARLISASSRGK